MNSGEFNYLDSLFGTNQQLRPVEMYIKDLQIKDKNETINNINNIFRDLSKTAETIEYIYSNNFNYIKKVPDIFSQGTKSQILYKFGMNSPAFQQCKKLHQKLISDIINDGKEINNNPDENEDIEMSIKDSTENDLNDRYIKEKISDINSLCNEMETALSSYKKLKKENEEKKRKEQEQKKRREEEQKMKREEEERKRKEEEKKKNEGDKKEMEIEKDNINIKENNIKKPENNIKENKKTVLVDGVIMVFEDEQKCLEKLQIYENTFKIKTNS